MESINTVIREMFLLLGGVAIACVAFLAFVALAIRKVVFSELDGEAASEYRGVSGRVWPFLKKWWPALVAVAVLALAGYFWRYWYVSLLINFFLNWGLDFYCLGGSISEPRTRLENGDYNGAFIRIFLLWVVLLLLIILDDDEEEMGYQQESSAE